MTAIASSILHAAHTDPAASVPRADAVLVSENPTVIDVTITSAVDLEVATVTLRIDNTPAPFGSVKALPHRPNLWRARLMTPTPTDPARLTVDINARAGSGTVLAARTTPAPQRNTAETPDWAKGLVWYQIFPERFRNANPANDPTGPWSTALEWSADWWTVDPLEIEAAWARRFADPLVHRYAADPIGGAFRSVVFDRRYGGDLHGVVQTLDYLEDLGVGGIYLCPIFQSRSLHKYDAADHRHIDAALGGSTTPPATYTPIEAETDDPATWTWTEADRFFLDTVLPETRQRGLRVMLDGVWNHVGLDHFAFADVRRNGEASPYADWFDAEFDDRGRLAGWRSWNGRNGGLPCFRQTPDGDLVEPVKEHIFAVTRRWMDPNGDGDPSDGIDGWRLDVAAEIGRPFWRDWRALVKSINPDALIVGENWHDAAEWFDGTAFDCQMLYPLADVVTGWLGRDPSVTAHDVARRLNNLTGRRPSVDLVQLTLLASHDTPRLASMLDNPSSGYDKDAGINDVFGGGFDPGPPSTEARRNALLGLALTVFWPGSPMIYGGDEFALAGPDDPSNRQPIIWPDQIQSVPVERYPDIGVSKATRSTLALREHPKLRQLLRYGSAVAEPLSDDSLVIHRHLNGQTVRAVLTRNEGAGDIANTAGVTGRRIGVDRMLTGKLAVVVSDPE